MGIRENKIETYLRKKVEQELGGITRKWVSPGRDGVPDQIVFIRGQIVFVEVKTEGGIRSNAQMREHVRLQDNGAVVHTLYGHKDVDLFIESLKHV